MAEYAHPEVLVDTAWVAEHLNDPSVRIVESNEDILLYDQGHIPGAIKIDWVADLNDQVVRDYLDREHFEKLLSAKSVEQAIEIQSGFAKRAYDGYMHQMSKIGGMYAELAKEAYKPVEKAMQSAR